ncbi:unnamed protein product (mitochondrion) [Musa textilis]
MNKPTRRQVTTNVTRQSGVASANSTRPSNGVRRCAVATNNGQDTTNVSRRSS